MSACLFSTAGSDLLGGWCTGLHYAFTSAQNTFRLNESRETNYTRFIYHIVIIGSNSTKFTWFVVLSFVSRPLLKTYLVCSIHRRTNFPICLRGALVFFFISRSVFKPVEKKLSVATLGFEPRPLNASKVCEKLIDTHKLFLSGSLK